MELSRVKGFSNRKKKKNKRKKRRIRYSSSILLVIIASIMALTVVTMAADYVQYAASSDVQDIGTPTVRVARKSEFTSNRKIGSVNMDNINEVMYGELDFGSMDIDRSLVPSDDAYRLNMEILATAIDVLDIEAYKEVYPIRDKVVLETFYELYDPLMLLSMSRTEWGSQFNPEYSITPFIPGNGLKSRGIKPSDITLSDITIVNYPWMSGYESGSYNGPLQIHYNYLPFQDIKIPAGKDKPSDEYRAEDAMLYIAVKFAKKLHDSDESYKYYTYQSPYEVAVTMSLAHNTGESVLTMPDEFQSSSGQPSYPWKNTAAMRQYISDVCRQPNLTALLDEVEKRYLEFSNDPASYNYSLKKLDVGPAMELYRLMDIDISEYFQPMFVDIFNASHNNSNPPREKAMFAIQAIYEYHMLRLFYTSGGGA